MIKLSANANGTAAKKIKNRTPFIGLSNTTHPPGWPQFTTRYGYAQTSKERAEYKMQCGASYCTYTYFQNGRIFDLEIAASKFIFLYLFSIT